MHTDEPSPCGVHTEVGNGATVTFEADINSNVTASPLASVARNVTVPPALDTTMRSATGAGAALSTFTVTVAELMRPSFTRYWNDPENAEADNVLDGVTLAATVHTDEPSPCGVHTGVGNGATVTFDGAKTSKVNASPSASLARNVTVAPATGTVARSATAAGVAFDGEPELTTVTVAALEDTPSLTV